MKFIQLILIALLATPLFAQEPGPHDFGRMWTFENPPTAWFAEAYDLDVDQAWFDKARMAALRFATWCSASFVSPDGLIMTNHHCSRGEMEALMQEGEDFDKNGFYAPTREAERRAEGLFVEQLLRAEDITARVKARAAEATSDQELLMKTQQAFQEIQAEYQQKPGWEDLRLQIVTYYSGGRYSIYGHRRYDDIRLVFIPELDMGFYGGDPDNFTYPRYNLDATFWRVYGDDGHPLDSREHYYRFNPDGIHDMEPVFVIGNPGSTERYRTVAQLEYDRDYRFPVQLKFMENRYALMEAEYAENPSHALQEQMFNFSNSIKAFTGIVGGLNNAELFARKVAMEKQIRASSGKEYWDQIHDSYDGLGTYLGELQFLSPNPQMMGHTITLLHALQAYREATEAPDDLEEGTLDEIKSEILHHAAELNTPRERALFATVLGELKYFADPGDTYIDDILKGRTPEAAAAAILRETAFVKTDKLEKLLEKKPKKVINEKDVLWQMAGTLVPMHHEAIRVFQSTTPARRALEQRVSNEVFNVLGSDLPPDATFTLRISDGRVKRYAYNGTIAPYKTTYFGLYDRHYSNDGAFPWSLPERWMNPPMELLKAPVNFVSTNDITGGNSGSPVINSRHEVVGLIFDGNIESLPGNFIYDETSSRSVSVHAGGITAALQYIYQANALLAELLGE